nr:hypothetical protein [uncultured Desulfobulbus sp.]
MKMLIIPFEQARMIAPLVKVALLVAHQAVQFLPFTFVALVVTELMLRYGVFAKLEPLGKPLTRMSRLPSVSTLTLITGMGSVLAANSMLVTYRSKNIINDRELVLSSLLNSIPVYLKELLTYHFPVILPLLGPWVGGIYLVTFWLAGVIKLAVVIVAGRLLLGSGREEGAGEKTRSSDGSGKQEEARFIPTLVDAVKKQSRLFLRITAYSLGMMFVVLLGLELGVFDWTDAVIGPMARQVGLPAVVLGPLGVYAVSPLAGVSSLAALLSQHLITGQQAIVALMIGGLVMAPIMYLRTMLPNYVGLFGAKIGGWIVLLSLCCALGARSLVLGLVLWGGHFCTR